MKRKLCVLLSITLVCMLLTNCGQPPAVHPSATGAGLAGDAGLGRFTIGYPCLDSQSERILTQCGYLRQLLDDAGWNVLIRPVLQSFDMENDRILTVPAIRGEIAADASADCYLVNDMEARELLDARLTQDFSTLLPGAAPSLAALYGPLLTSPMPGLPTTLPMEDRYNQAALHLSRTVAADSKAAMTSMSGVLDFLEPNVSVIIQAPWAFGGYGSILGAWAGEQGYYPLSFFGLFPEFYARYGDKNCSPVPIEAIPGFDWFFLRASMLRMEGSIVDYGDNMEGSAEDVAGVLGSTHSIDINFLVSKGTTGDDYLAFPLTGCVNPARPGVDNAYWQLAVPAGNDKAVEIAAFMEWVLTDQQNYDLVRHGTLNRDNRLVEGRVEYLSGGKPLTKEDLESNRPYFMNHLPLIRGGPMERPTVYQPYNYEPIMSSITQPQMELWPIAAFNARTGSDVFDFFAVDASPYQQLNQTRFQLLTAMAPYGGQPADPQACLDRLHGLAAETDKLVEACKK